MELDGSTSRSEEEEEYSKDGIFLSDMFENEKKKKK